jgi:hypothetical protein
MLFDLSNDEMETEDISAENPKIYKELKSLYNKWDKDLALPKWTDPHLQNVKKEEQNVQTIRYNSLSKNERENYNL